MIIGDGNVHINVHAPYWIRIVFGMNRSPEYPDLVVVFRRIGCVVCININLTEDSIIRGVALTLLLERALYGPLPGSGLHLRTDRLSSTKTVTPIL